MHRTALFSLAALTLTVSAALAHFGHTLSVRAQVAPAVVARGGEGVHAQLQLSHTTVNAAGGDVFAEVVVKADPELTTRGPGPVSMALVLDTSGSMDGFKLIDAKAAAKRLVALLGPDDELALVRFSTDVTATPLWPMTEQHRAEALAFIDGLTAGGGTNIGGGVRAGSEALSHALHPRRLVLVSDGQPTHGATSTEELGQLVATEHRADVTLTALGVGADYNSALMQALADQGGGFYGYLKDAGRLEEVLALELAQARHGFAQQVQLALEPGPGFRVVEVPGRTLVWSGREVTVPLPDLAPGAEARVYVKLRGATQDADVASVLATTLRWQPVNGEHRQAEPTRLAVALPVVDDEEAFEASRQEEVFSAAVRAIGTTQLVLAAAAYERGDDASAFSLLDNTRALFGMSADALAGESETLSRTRSEWSRPHSADERKHLSKDLERKKLSNFGKHNDY